jgi:hypothetical protein
MAGPAEIKMAGSGLSPSTARVHRCRRPIAGIEKRSYSGTTQLRSSHLPSGCPGFSGTGCSPPADRATPGATGRVDFSNGYLLLEFYQDGLDIIERFICVGDASAQGRAVGSAICTLCATIDVRELTAAAMRPLGGVEANDINAGALRYLTRWQQSLRYGVNARQHE